MKKEKERNVYRCIDHRHTLTTSNVVRGDPLDPLTVQSLLLFRCLFLNQKMS
jgi:hypothetical protein